MTKVSILGTLVTFIIQRSSMQKTPVPCVGDRLAPSAVGLLFLGLVSFEPTDGPCAGTFCVTFTCKTIETK